MVVKKKETKKSKKVEKKEKKNKKVEVKTEEEHSGGASLDDAFADSEDVEYGKPKEKSKKKKAQEDEEDAEEEELEEELDEIQASSGSADISEDYKIESKKPIVELKKGNKVKIDDVEYEIDAHYVLIDHGATKEMVIEIFNPKTDKDYQLRYFNDQVETTLQLYELQEILYVRRAFKKINW